MTTYSGTKQATGIQPKFIERGEIKVCSSFALSAALVLNDVVQMVTLPVGATVTSVLLSTDTALDTNASSTIAYSVGDGGSATRYISAKAQGNNIPLAPYAMDQAAGHQFVITSSTNVIQVKVSTGPATGATTGTMRLTVGYSMDV